MLPWCAPQCPVSPGVPQPHLLVDTVASWSCPQIGNSIIRVYCSGRERSGRAGARQGGFSTNGIVGVERANEVWRGPGVCTWYR